MKLQICGGKQLLFIDAYLRICWRGPTNITTNLLRLPVSENKCDPGTSRIGSRGVNPGSKYFVSTNIIISSEVKWEFHSVDAPFRMWDDNRISTQRTEARPPKDHSRTRKLYKHHTKCQFAVPYSRFNSQELYEIQTMDRLTTYL
jgi:hypothetical protein